MKRLDLSRYRKCGAFPNARLRFHRKLSGYEAFFICCTHGDDVKRSDWIVSSTGDGKVFARIHDDSDLGLELAGLVCDEMNRRSKIHGAMKTRDEVLAIAAETCPECKKGNIPSYWTDGAAANADDIIVSHGAGYHEIPCDHVAWREYFWERDKGQLRKEAGR